MAEYVTIPLDIEGVKVGRVEGADDGEVHIYMSSTVKDAKCHRCGRDIQASYDEGREIKLRHLPNASNRQNSNIGNRNRTELGGSGYPQPLI